LYAARLVFATLAIIAPPGLPIVSWKRMKTTKEDLRERELRRAARRIGEIHRELAARPSTPLPKKIFAGHWRFLAVRADVLRSSVGSQVQQVVDKCNHWVLGRKSSPPSYRASTEVAVSPAATAFISGQGLRPLGAEEWLSAGFPDFFEDKWFRKIPRLIRVGTKNIELTRYFPQVPDHMLEFAYKPAYITETRLPGGDLESELRRLYSTMNAAHGWERLDGRHTDEWDMSVRRRRLREKEQILEARAWDARGAQ
jgi:hypothetical protein